MSKFHPKKLLTAMVAVTALTFGTYAMAGAGIRENFTGCSPGRTVFFAYHQNHEKAVEVCKVKGGYRYSNGPLGRPEISIIKPTRAVKRIALDPGSGFTFRNGDYLYWLTQDVYGKKYLMATRGRYRSMKHPLAKIPLDSEGWGYTNNSYRLSE